MWFGRAVAAVWLAALGAAPVTLAESDTIEIEFETEPSGWEVDIAEGGSWSVADGSLNGSGHAWYSYTDHDWDDLAIAFSGEFSGEGSGGLHLNFRAADGSRYRFAIRQFDDYDDYGTSIELWKDTPSGSFSPPDGGVDTEQITGQFDVTASVEGGHLEMTVTGDWSGIELVAKWDDPEPLPPGKFGFESLGYTDQVEIDWVRLEGTVSVEPPTPLPPDVEPDLALFELSATPIAPDRVGMSATVMNVGDADAFADVVFVELDGDPIGEILVGRTLAPGEGVDVGDEFGVPDHLVSIRGHLTAWVVATDDIDPGNNGEAVGVALPRDLDPPVDPVPPGGATPAPVDRNDDLDIPDPVDDQRPFIAPPAGDESDVPWVAVGGAAGAGAVAAAAGATAIRRRAVRRRRQLGAEDAPREGRCQPGKDEYTQRDIDPEPHARHITEIGVEMMRPGASEVELHPVDDDALVAAFEVALVADRLGVRRRRDSAVATAAERLAEVVGGLDLTEATEVAISAGYEGAKAKATFSTWRCASDGTWPTNEVTPHRCWTADVTDSDHVLSPSLALHLPLDRSALTTELADMSRYVVGLVNERRHARPHVTTHLGVE